jgi:hypothetical protein
VNNYPGATPIFISSARNKTSGKWRTVPSPGQEVWNPSGGPHEYIWVVVYLVLSLFIAANTPGLGYVDLFFSGCGQQLRRQLASFRTDGRLMGRKADWVYSNLGGYCTSRPVAVSKSTGRIGIFCPQRRFRTPAPLTQLKCRLDGHPSQTRSGLLGSKSD